MERMVGLALATLAAVTVLVLVKGSVVALSLWLNASWPEKTQQIYRTYRARPWRCFFIGAINTVVFVFIGLVLLSREPVALLGLLLLVTVVALQLWGRTAAHRHTAVKLDIDGGEYIGLRSYTVGAVVTELVFLLPVIGQLLYLGLSLRGMGAVVIALLARGDGATDTPEHRL